jgi:hypothetical protein
MHYSTPNLILSYYFTKAEIAFHVCAGTPSDAANGAATGIAVVVTKLSYIQRCVLLIPC